MNKLSAFILLLLMLLGSSGFFVAFQIKMYSIKQTQKKIILSSELRDQYIHELSFSKNDIEKGMVDINFKEKNEIKYNGKMYDIISQKTNSDSIFIHCISDEEEDFTLALSENKTIKRQKTQDAKDLSDLKYKLNTFIFEINPTATHIIAHTARMNPTTFNKRLPIPFIHSIFSPPWC